MIKLDHIQHLTKIDFLMVLFFSLGVFEKISYYFGISHLYKKADRPGNYFSCISYFTYVRYIDAFCAFTFLFLLALGTISALRVSAPSIYFDWKQLVFDGFVGVVFGLYISLYIVEFSKKGDSREILNETIRYTVIPAIIGGIASLGYSYLYNRGITDTPFSSIGIWLLWPICCFNIFAKYIHIGEIYSAGAARNWGYIKDVIYLAVILFLVAKVPVLIRLAYAKNQAGIIAALAMSAAVIAVIAANLDIKFPESAHGKNYIRDIITWNSVKAPCPCSESDLAGIIRWHGIFGSGILLLVGVVFVFVTECLYYVKKLLM